MSGLDGSDDSRPDVLSKADEFIKRRRTQLDGVAADGRRQAEPADDIPLLTEVVADANLTANPASAGVTTHKDISTEIARELDAWLDENLPQAVVRVMDGITDNLILQIQQSADKDLLPRLKQALLGNVKNSED